MNHKWDQIFVFNRIPVLLPQPISMKGPRYIRVPRKKFHLITCEQHISHLKYFYSISSYCKASIPRFQNLIQTSVQKVSVVASYYNRSSIDDIDIDILTVCMTSLESGYSEQVALVVSNSDEYFAGDSMGTDSDTGIDIGFDLDANIDFDIDLGKNSGLA